MSPVNSEGPRGGRGLAELSARLSEYTVTLAGCLFKKTSRVGK